MVNGNLFHQVLFYLCPMGKIYCIGEAVYDIIFKNDKPVEGRPGGAMLNSAVSLGRLGAPVAFIGDFADDYVGKMCCRFLEENGVDTKDVTMYAGARSRIALAFLNDQCNAEYTFYKISVADPSLTLPVPERGDLILFGSWFGIKPEIRAQLADFLKFAREAGAFLIYDPNFRKAHLNMLSKVRAYIDENISLAHITKGSDEDFHYILGTCDVSKIHHYTESLGCRHLIYTANRNGVWLFDREVTSHYPAMSIKPVSTVGAGDSFNAGLVYSLMKMGLKPEDMESVTPEQWQEIITTAIRFASEVCLSFDNYISKKFAIDLRDEHAQG
jgi:fructokinase